MGSARTLLGNRTLARCEQAWAVSVLGTWTFSIVLALYAYYEHGPAGVGLAVAARMLPAVVFATLPALIAGRWSRRSAVFISALVRFRRARGHRPRRLGRGAVRAAAGAGCGVRDRGRGASARREPAWCSSRLGSRGDLAALHWSRLVTLVGLLAGAVTSAVVVLVVSLHAAFAVAGLVFLAVAAIAWRLPIGGAPAAVSRTDTTPGQGGPRSERLPSSRGCGFGSRCSASRLRSSRRSTCCSWSSRLSSCTPATPALAGCGPRSPVAGW